MQSEYDRLTRAAAVQLASEGQITLMLYAEIEDSGFDVNGIVDAAEKLNKFTLKK